MRTHSFFLLVTLLLVGCGSREPVTVATYNAGLAVGFVPAALARGSITATAIGDIEADIVCVQEVWEPEHIEELEAAAASNFPHQFIPDPQQVTSEDIACDSADLAPLMTCMVDNCTDVCIEEQTNCLFDNCAFLFLGLPPTCGGCVQAMVGNDPDVVTDACSTGTTSFAYDGAFGTGIFSAHEILESEELLMESTTTHRSVLHAVVDAPIGEVDVYCTHLTPVFSLIPWPKEEGSWEEEQQDQIDTMVGFIDETALSGQTIVMGDMNTGPDGTGGVEAEQPGHYNDLAAGRRNPYLTQDGRCTFCPENPLISVDTDQDPRIIDHVLLSGIEGTTTATRILDEEFETDYCDGTITSAYSDHYGVTVTIEP